MPRAYRVAVHLQGVLAVLELVVHPLHARWQLARLPYRHERRAQLQGDRSAEDEAAALDSRDMGYCVVRERRRHRPDRAPEERCVQEDRRDVLENDSGTRKVGHVPDRSTERRLEMRVDQEFVRLPSIRHQRAAISNGAGSISADDSALTRSSATLAPSGPRLSSTRKGSISPGSASTRISTLPSGSFRTHPGSASERAARRVNHRKPTPCTTPVTRTR